MRAWTPALAKRWIASELRSLRAATGLSQHAVANHLKVSPSRMRTLEGAEVVPRDSDFDVLLNLYGVPERIAEFVEMRVIAKKRSWWNGIYAPPFPQWIEQYLGLEEGAVQLDCWNSLVVHELLQTQEYAHAQLTEAMPDAAPKDIADRVNLTMRRQKVWQERGDDRAKLNIILSESALRLSFGSSTVMREQYRKLIALDPQWIDLRVLPMNSEAHGAIFSPFSRVHLDIPGDTGTVYTEIISNGIYQDNPQTIANTDTIFGQLTTAALSPKASRDFIHNLLAELPNP